MAGTLNKTLSDRKKGLISVKTILVDLMQEKDIPAGIKEELNSYLAMYNNEIDSIKIREDIKEGVELPKKKEPKVEKLEYARMWTLKTELEGELIHKNEYNDIKKKKNNYDIFIIDRGEYGMGSVGEVYIDKQPVFHQPEKIKKSQKIKNKKYLIPLEYRVLVYTLKQKGKPGDILVLIEQCWDAPEIVKRLAETKKEDRAAFSSASSGYRKTIGVVSSLLYAKLGVKLKTSGKAIYRFSKQVDFCLLETIQESKYP